MKKFTYLATWVVALLVILWACSKNDPALNNTTPTATVPTVSTGTTVANITATTATIKGTATGTGITEAGFYYSEGASLSLTPTKKTATPVSDGSISADLTNLTGGKGYSFQAFAVNSVGEKKGEIVQFTTTSPSCGVLATLSANSISGPTQTTATATAKLDNAGENCQVTEYGHIWRQGNDGNFDLTTASIGKAAQTASIANGATFTSGLTGLTANTDYQVRAYVTNGKGTQYTLAVPLKTATAPCSTSPTLSGNGITGTPTQTTATASAKIDNAGANCQVTEYGHIWIQGTNTTFDINTANIGKGSKTASIANGTAFSTDIAGLTANTDYQVRAYAKNGNSTQYTAAIPLKTAAVAAVCNTSPTLSGNSITGNPTQTTATASAKIDNAGANCQVTEYGHIWIQGTNTTFDINTANIGKGSKTTSIANGAAFSTDIAGLTANTDYQVRAYAKNGNSTQYTAAVPLKTAAVVVACTVAPTTSTSNASSVAQTTAVLTGKIDTEGNAGCDVTEYGFIYIAGDNPGVSLTTAGVLKTMLTTAINAGSSFNANLASLQPSTTYTFKSYAKNNANLTSYSTAKTFTTLASVCNTAPVVTINTSVGNLTQNSTTVGGVISSEGSSPCNVTEYGHVWVVGNNANVSLTTAGVQKSTFTANATVGTSFVSVLSSLTGGTQYSVRAYAKNAFTTDYSSAITFTTLPATNATLRFTNKTSMPISLITVADPTARNITIPSGTLAINQSIDIPVKAGSITVQFRMALGASCTIVDSPNTFNVVAGTTYTADATNPTVAQLMTDFRASGYSTYTAVQVLPGGGFKTYNYRFYVNGTFVYEDSAGLRQNGVYILLLWNAGSSNIVIRTNIAIVGDFVIPCPYNAFATNGLNFAFEFHTN